MRPYYSDSEVTIYLGDCREILPSLKSQYDFMLSDPPYGIAYDVKESKHGHNFDFLEIQGDAELFDPSHLPFAEVPSILWGANNFADRLPNAPRPWDKDHLTHAWIAWLKTAVEAIAQPGNDDRRLSRGVQLRKADMELAWTNFVRRPQACIMPWIGNKFDWADGQKKFHPTQKPIALMDWCLQLAPTHCKTVIDPYMGAGPTLFAASCIEGWRAIGIEVEERYCEIAAKRFAKPMFAAYQPKLPRGILSGQVE